MFKEPQDIEAQIKYLYDEIAKLQTLKYKKELRKIFDSGKATNLEVRFIHDGHMRSFNAAELFDIKVKD